jgi:hypothetical protein
MSVNRFAPKDASTEFNARPFTWSYSKLKNYESCPRKHFQVDLLKAFEEQSNPQLEDGKKFHDWMATVVRRGVVSGQCALPPQYAKFQPLANKLMAVTAPGQVVKVEQQLAITRDLKPCTYFAKDVWFRGVIDYMKIVPVRDHQIVVAIDYKTGKQTDDPVQLALFAQLIFSHFPNTLKIRTDYYWTQDEVATREDFEPRDMLQLWTVLLPRVAKLEESYTTGQYPVKPSGLCKKHCPDTSCVHNGGRE